MVTAGYGVYATFISPKPVILNNYEVNSTFTLSNASYRNLAYINATDGGYLWVNFTTNGPLTLFILNETQMSNFNPGSAFSSYYSPGTNLTNFSSSKPIDLVGGYYHLIFYNEGTSAVTVISANVTWNLA